MRVVPIASSLSPFLVASTTLHVAAFVGWQVQPEPSPTPALHATRSISRVELAPEAPVVEAAAEPAPPAPKPAPKAAPPPAPKAAPMHAPAPGLQSELLPDEPEAKSEAPPVASTEPAPAEDRGRAEAEALADLLGVDLDSALAGATQLGATKRRLNTSARAALIDSIRNKVQSLVKLAYPFEARRSKLGGRARIRLRLDENGYVAEEHLLLSTGHEVLDHEIHAILHLGEPYPSVQGWFEIPIEFKPD